MFNFSVMRRRRAGQTSPQQPETSMSMSDTDNVGQFEAREIKAATNKETPNTGNVNPAAAATSIKTSAAPAAAKPEFGKRKSIQPDLLPKSYESPLPTPVHATPASVPLPATCSATTSASAISKKSPPAAISRPTSPAVPVRPKLPATDESSTDDESVSKLTISHDPRIPIPCIHTVTCSKSYKPKRLLCSPYRKTLLALLCRVRSESTDSYSPSRAKSAADRTQIYACYQQHWSPKFNIPVLTLVACCNVTISSPIIERSEPDTARLTFLCTSPSEQSKIVFDIPLFSTLDSVNQSVMLQLGPHHPLPDSLTSWFIKSSENDIVLTWVKVWHLSPIGCFNLHNHGVFVPQRPFPEAEIHFLGLTGKRKMPYRINQLDYTQSLLAMMDPTDLGNIGYKKYEPCKKPSLPRNGTLVHRLPEPPIPRTQMSPEWYYDNGLVVQATHKLKRWPQFEPPHYPFPFNHRDHHDEFPDPILFPTGEIAFRQPLILPHTTLDDMITEAARKNPKEDPIATLMIYFNFRRQDIETRYMKMPFVRFLQDKTLPPDDYNGKCQFDALINGHNTGERYLVPKSWFPMQRHPLIIQ